MAEKGKKMPFDLSAVSTQAQRFSGNDQNQSSGGNRSYDYNLLYPGTPGMLQIKLLFNPKAGNVSRLVYNHKINGTNVPCMRTWDQDCPICKALQDIKNATGTDHSQMRSTTRAISLAQVVGDKYPLGDNIHPGDIVLFMYPWTVFRDIQQIIGQAKNEQELALLVASNEGMVFNITHGEDNRYSTQTDPFARYKTCATDEEFETLLNGLKSLNELYRPSSPSEDNMNAVNEAAKSLRSTFLGENEGNQQNQQTSFATTMANQTMGFQQTPQSNFQQTPPQNNFQQVPQPNMASQMGFQVPQSTPSQQFNPMNSIAPAPAPAVDAPTNTMMNQRPTCFGRYGTVNPDQCSLCGSEFECIESSPK